jgi:hypothetical protein
VSRFLRAFVGQPKDPDEGATAAGAALDATGCPFLIFVRVNDDVRVVGGPVAADVVDLVRSMQSKGTLEKVVERFSQ